MINRSVLARLERLAPALESGWRADPQGAVALLRRLETATGETLDALREITHGLFPAMLSRRGVAAALRAHLATVGLVDVLQVETAVAERRFPAATEAAAYFCCLASLADLGRPTGVRLGLRDGMLVLDVSGSEPARQEQATPPEPVFLTDRVEAVGGLLRRERGPDGTLVLHAELPAAGR
jgi:signal transduction histidine kinase